jgi:hypothetical protein
MPRPGQRTALYISGGFTFYRKPRIDAPDFQKAQSEERSRTGKLYRDSLQPKAGWPVVLTKLALPLSWTLMAGSDIRAANDIIAIEGPFDVCYWKEISESFYVAAGDPLEGFLQRRSVLDVVSPLPPNAATLYPVTGRRGDGSAMTVTLGTPDADGVTPWSAPGTSTGEKVLVRYTPVFIMSVDEGQTTFPQPQAESQTLTFREN